MAQVKLALRRGAPRQPDLIKIFADWTYPTLTIEEMSVIVEEAHKAGRRVAAHADTTAGIRNAVTAGVDSIEHGFRVDRATLELMKQKGIAWVPTYGRRLESLAKLTDEEIRPRATARMLEWKKNDANRERAGCQDRRRMGPGDEKDHGTNADKIVLLTTAGLTSLEALRAATINGAELLGWQDRIGSLETGKLPDFIAVSGNPLADIKQVEHVKFVMKGVHLASAPSTHRQR